MVAFDSASTYQDRGSILAAFRNAAAITPDDANDLLKSTRAIYVGVAGDVVVDLIGSGTAITFKALPVGIHPFQVKRVHATGTTATNLVALW